MRNFQGCNMMEQLPVEVIGKILSHLSSARDVVIASATCRT
ncbi:F-box/LRR-repeat protein, partial [Trifolium medium]|nr:F-box/LRR-repeat protein [Trifolium medium]